MSDLDILVKEAEIDIAKYNFEFLYGFSFEDFNESTSVFEAGEISQKLKEMKERDKDDDKKPNVLVRIFKRLYQLISDLIESVSNLFHPREGHLDLQTFLRSSSGKIVLENDLLRVQDQVNDEVRKGREIVQAISRGTKIDDRIVEKYVDGATKGIKRYGRTALTTAQSINYYNKSTGKMEKLKKEMKDGIDILNYNYDEHNKVVLTPVVKAIQTWINYGIDSYNTFIHTMRNEAKRNGYNDDLKTLRPKRNLEIPFLQ